MKTIKIGLEHREVFQVMTNCKVKRIILGLMDVANGNEPRAITKDILPMFKKLREQLSEGESNHDGHKWHDGLDELLDTYEEKRMSYEEKVKALKRENDTVIRAESDACEEEAKAIEDEHKALEGEYKALMARLKACDGDEDGRRRYKGKFMALEKRRKALRERRGALDERRRAVIERSVNFLAASASNLEKECGVLKEENKLLKGARADFDTEWKPITEWKPVNREEEIIGSKPNDCLPPVTDEPVAKEGREANEKGLAFTPEVWKVIDENWEELKDAVRRIKTEKEKSEDIPLSVLESIPLSVDAWDVLDHHFDELVRLFHL